MALTTVSQHVVSVNAIQGTLIADNAITAVHIATNAVSGTLIADNAVTATHIAQNTITVTQLADDAVEADKIADGVITTNHLNKAMISSQTEVTPVAGDFVLIGDTSDSNNLKKVPISGITALAAADGITASGSNTIIQSPDDTSVLYVNNSAQVGIGTDSPAAKLDVNLTGAGDAVKITGNSITDFDFVGNPPEFNLEDSDSTSGQKRARITLNSQQLNIQGLSDDDSALTYQFITCDLSNGYVGINTTSPARLLHVKAADANVASFEGHQGEGVVIVSNTNGRIDIVGYDDGASSYNELVLRAQGSSDSLKLKTDGQIHLQGQSTNDVMTVLHGSTANANVGMILFRDGASDFCGQITSNGSTNTTSYNTSSDIRLKNVLGEAKGLEIINQLNPVHFEWKKSGIKQDGLIAQEVEPIVPNAVAHNEESDVYSIDYSKLVTPLIKAIQELEARIKTLEG